MKRGKERRRRELFEIKRKGKTKTKSVFDMAEIKRKRGELKRRVRVVVKVLWVKKKKKRGKKRDFDGCRFTVRKQPFLPPYYSFLLLLSFSLPNL